MRIIWPYVYSIVVVVLCLLANASSSDVECPNDSATERSDGLCTLGTNLIINGDFEDNVVTDNTSSLGISNALNSGWVDIGSAPAQVHEQDYGHGNATGDAIVEIESGVYIRQTVTITDAGTYRLAFDATRRGDSDQDNTFALYVDNVLHQTITVDASKAYIFDLELESGDHSLGFNSLSSDYKGAGIDDVTLQIYVYDLLTTDNLVVNGDFEDNVVTDNTSSLGLSNALNSGWVDIGSAPAQVHEQDYGHGNATGDAIVELEFGVYIRQTVTITDAGTYRLAFDATRRGDSDQDNTFELYIDNVLYQTITVDGSKTYIFDLDLESGDHSLGFNSLSSDYKGAGIDDVKLQNIDDLLLIAEWRFEDESWIGDSDEVTDSSGNGYHGQLVSGASLQSSSPALSGSSGTCGYGSFSRGMISVSDLPASTATGAKTTVSFWMRWDGTNSAMPVGWSYYDLWFYNGSFGFNTWNNDIYGISSSSLSGGWHHITAEFTNGYSPVTSNRLWVDGVEQSLSQRRGTPSSSYRSAGSNFRIGGASNSSSYRFYGELDEVKIYNGSLSQSQVVEVMNQTHPCGITTVDSFLIAHDNSGLYCLDESISVSARDSDGAVITTYNDTITLDTQTGTGSWSLVSGGGSLVDAVNNDGLAIYTFAESDNGTASFALSYTEGNLAVDVDAYNDDARDDDSEGNLTFLATGFSVTHTPLSNPPVTPINDPVSSPKNSAESFTIAVAAYGVDPNNGQCGIIETYTGNKNITLTTNYSNPTTGTLLASGSGIVGFTAGQAVLTTQYNDVGEISLTVSDTSANMTGQSNTFVVKPTDFSINVTDNPATTTSGTGFIAAGEAFTVTVQALNALGDATPNYGNEQVPEGVTLSLDSLVFPSGGSLGVLSNANSFTKIANNSFQNEAVHWSEAGSIRLSASIADANYLGAGDVTSAASGAIGRFYPYDFFVSGNSVVNSCSSFTYLSQPDLSLMYTVTAITRDGDTVTNYDAGLGYPVGTAEYVAEDNNDGNNLGTRMSVATAVWSAGEYSVSDVAAAFARTNTRETPLNDVVLGISIDDADDVPMNAANMNASTNDDCEVSASCNAVSLGSASFYYGRLTLADAYGPETAALPAQLLTEYWDGTQFLTNVYDSCSVIPRSAISFNGTPILTSNDLTVNLIGGNTSAQFDALTTSHVGFVSGDANLSFSAPGASITTKSFIVNIDTSTLDWFRSDWNQNNNDNDDAVLPTATMSFKTYRGHDRVLYWRHNN
jgi:hypothetical protein